jgi:ketosteroid isomerase-like protein
MSRLCQLTFGLLLLFAALTPFFTPAATNPDVLSEIRDRWMFAAKEGDAVKLASVFAENGTLMPPGFPSFTGRQAIESFYRDTFGMSTIRSAELHPQEHHTGTNSVREHGTYSVTFVPRDESLPPYTQSGRYLFIGTKRPDGKWEILWEMHTIEPKVPLDQL